MARARMGRRAGGTAGAPLTDPPVTGVAEARPSLVVKAKGLAWRRRFAVGPPRHGPVRTAAAGIGDVEAVVAGGVPAPELGAVGAPVDGRRPLGSGRRGAGTREEPARRVQGKDTGLLLARRAPRDTPALVGRRTGCVAAPLVPRSVRGGVDLRPARVVDACAVLDAPVPAFEARREPRTAPRDEVEPAPERGERVVARYPPYVAAVRPPSDTRMPLERARLIVGGATVGRAAVVAGRRRPMRRRVAARSAGVGVGRPTAPAALGAGAGRSEIADGTAAGAVAAAEGTADQGVAPIPARGRAAGIGEPPGVVPLVVVATKVTDRAAPAPPKLEGRTITGPAPAPVRSEATKSPAAADAPRTGAARRAA